MPVEINVEDLPDEDEVVEAAPVAVEEPVAEAQEEPDVLEILEPQTEPREVKLSYGGRDATYLQKPLAYFRKMEFFSLLGRTIDVAMEGDDGLRVNTLLGALPSSVTDIADLDSFLSLVAKIASYAPDFLKESYLLWLDLPKSERAWARDAL